MSKERRVIHFSSGETLEEEGSEEEEGGNDQPAFTELANTVSSRRLWAWETMSADVALIGLNVLVGRA